MTHHDRNWTFALLSFAASLLLAPGCFAQVPGFARSEGRFAVSTERCLEQASRAFKSRGFTVTDVFAETHVVFAKREIDVAAIACNEAPGRMTWVNIVVASSSGDNAPALREAQTLIDQMERLARERRERDRR
jgi:hypothetical protein